MIVEHALNLKPTANIEPTASSGAILEYSPPAFGWRRAAYLREEVRNAMHIFSPLTKEEIKSALALLDAMLDQPSDGPIHNLFCRAVMALPAHRRNVHSFEAFCKDKHGREIKSETFRFNLKDRGVDFVRFLISQLRLAWGDSFIGRTLNSTLPIVMKTIKRRLPPLTSHEIALRRAKRQGRKARKP